jgi:hypothetical protein
MIAGAFYGLPFHVSGLEAINSVEASFNALNCSLNKV